MSYMSSMCCDHPVSSRRPYRRWVSRAGIVIVITLTYYIRNFQVSSKFFKDEFKFRLIVCATTDDLFAHVEKSQVTQDLDGDLMYSHHEWIQQRIVSNSHSSSKFRKRISFLTLMHTVMWDSMLFIFIWVYGSRAQIYSSPQRKDSSRIW